MLCGVGFSHSAQRGGDGFGEVAAEGGEVGGELRGAPGGLGLAGEEGIDPLVEGGPEFLEEGAVFVLDGAPEFGVEEGVAEGVVREFGGLGADALGGGAGAVDGGGGRFAGAGAVVVGVGGDDAAEVFVEGGVRVLEGVAVFVPDEGGDGALGVGVEVDGLGIVATDGSAEDGWVAGFYKLDAGAGEAGEVVDEVGKGGSGVHSIQVDGGEVEGGGGVEDALGAELAGEAVREICGKGGLLWCDGIGGEAESWALWLRRNGPLSGDQLG